MSLPFCSLLLYLCPPLLRASLFSRWAAGVERLALVLDRTLVPQPPRPIYVLVIGGNEEAPTNTHGDNVSPTSAESSEKTAALTAYAMHVSECLRKDGFPVIQKVDHEGGKLRKLMKKALRANATAVVFIGADEHAAGLATVKLLDYEEQRTVPVATLPYLLSKGRVVPPEKGNE